MEPSLVRLVRLTAGHPELPPMPACLEGGLPCSARETLEAERRNPEGARCVGGRDVSTGAPARTSRTDDGLERRA
jgi:hypothetical protein